MKSMTGYGRGEYSNEGLSLVVEIKTVNNRYLDLNLKYPKGFLAFDDLIRKTIAKGIVRGKTDVFINYTDTRKNSKNITVDLALAQSLVESSKTLKEAFPDLRDDFSLNTLMKTQDLLIFSNEVDNDELAAIIEETINKAIDSLNKMREIEGAKLKKDMLSRVDTIKTYVDEISKIAPSLAENYKEKLLKKVSDALSNADVDMARLIEEVTIFTDKSNIDEELTRLNSHISQFKLLCEEKGDVGKKIDFLIQEFNRESNTICSKANDISITQTALKLKNEIEKIREQIQNIE